MLRVERLGVLEKRSFKSFCVKLHLDEHFDNILDFHKLESIEHGHLFSVCDCHWLNFEACYEGLSELGDLLEHLIDKFLHDSLSTGRVDLCFEDCDTRIPNGLILAERGKGGFMIHIVPRALFESHVLLYGLKRLVKLHSVGAEPEPEDVDHRKELLLIRRRGSC